MSKSGPKSQGSTSAVAWVEVRSTQGISVLRSGTNLKIELNRPRNGNALTVAMMTDLTELFKSAATDPTISCIALTANGKYFCTGMDLSRDTSPVGQGGSTSDTQFARLTDLFDAIDSAPQVTIACVQGPAFGGGVGLAFACDLRLFADTATVSLTEAKLGLCPAVISKYLVREWGAAVTREAMLTCRAIPATELARLGLIMKPVTGKMAPILDQLLIRLRDSSARGSAMCKELVKLGALSGQAAAKQAEGIQRLFDEMMGSSSEGAHGLKCFHAGQKNIDWDTYTLGRTKAKL